MRISFCTFRMGIFIPSRRARGARPTIFYTFYMFYTAKAIPLQHHRAGGRAVFGFLREARHDRGYLVSPWTGRTDSPQ